MYIILKNCTKTIYNAQEDNIKIPDCPRCGSPAHVVMEERTGQNIPRRFFGVECSVCKTRTVIAFSTPHSAVQFWDDCAKTAQNS